MREIERRGDTGTVLRLLSNDPGAPAREIAELYRRRRAVELFSRWVKRTTLRISRFPGTSEDAVRIQIAVALIAVLLLRRARATQAASTSPRAFSRAWSAPTPCIRAP